MTNYHLKPPVNPLPYSSWQEAREKRRAVLARAAEVRKANFQRFMKRKSAISNIDVENGEI